MRARRFVVGDRLAASFGPAPMNPAADDPAPASAFAGRSLPDPN
jgi:hypothetical protein